MGIFTTYAVLVFIFGTIVGSFLNVVVYRYGTGQGVARGRSKCFTCRKTLAWYELVPVLSFVFLRAKCSACQSKISWQYPLVELFTGLVFAGVFASVRPGFSYGDLVINLINLLLLFIAAALLIAIAAYDWRHMIIPDGLVYGLIGVSVIFSLVTSSHNLVPTLITTLGLFIFFWALWFFSGGAWMGFGDAKLAIAIGLLLGWPLGISAVVLAFWLGAVVGVGLLLWPKLVHTARSRRGRQLVTMKTEVPFAPFLVLATILVLIFQFNVIIF